MAKFVDLQAEHNPLGLTRSQVAVRLLAHGPLTSVEFAEITGWRRTHCWHVLARLRGNGTLQLRHVNHRCVYVLPNAPQAS